MRILAVSDLRVHDVSHLERIAKRESPDLIVYAGDDVHRFGEGTNSWSPLAQRTKYGLAGVIGNDCSSDDAAVFSQPGCHDLHRQALRLEGLSILGLQGAPGDEGDVRGPTRYTRQQAKAHLRRQSDIAGDAPVLLVSHAPPRGILDFSLRFSNAEIGSTAVREFARARGVKAIICGHAHFQGGRCELLEGCIVVNVASHDDHSAALRCAILEWDGRRIHLDKIYEDRSGEGIAAIPHVRHRTATRLREGGFRCPDDLLRGDGREIANILGSASQARAIRARARALCEQVPVLLGSEPALPSHAQVIDVSTSSDQNDPWLVSYQILDCKSRVRQLYELRPERHSEHLRRVDRAFTRARARSFLQWGVFERTALTRAYERVGLASPAWLQASRWIDVERLVRDTVALPLPNGKLRTVSTFFGFSRSIEGGGIADGSCYSLYKKRGTPFDEKAAHMHGTEDVRAVARVLEGVRELKGSLNTLVEPAVPTASTKVR